MSDPAAIAGIALRLLEGALMVAEMRAEDRAEIEAQAAKLRATLGAGPSEETMTALEAEADAIIERLKARAGK